MTRLAGLALAAALAAAAPARAEELLRGPHPFLRGNELTVHGGMALGFGDTFAGPKAAVDYGYRLSGGLWLDLGLGFLSGGCRPRMAEGLCERKGDSAEVVAGAKYKFRMNVPVVPYLKAVAGLAYLFPDEADAAMGVTARAGVGAKYFPYDWIGVGIEVMYGVGHAAYDDDAPLARPLVGLDLLGGAELQF